MKLAATRQRGVALISVLLVFALAAIIASEVVSRNYRDIRRTTNFISGKQAYHYALSGEAFARQILYRDFKETTVDSLTDTWAQELETFDIDDGAMTIEITDLHSRFNINNLIDSNGRLDRNAAVQFQRLLRVLSIGNDYIPVLADWLDRDQVKTATGAEDAEYWGSDYLAANRPMTDKTELRLLMAMNFEDYEKLKNYIVALPKTVAGKDQPSSQYNINTMDAKLVQALANTDTSQAAKIASSQQSGGYNTVNSWLSSGVGQPLRSVRGQLAVNSEFFEVTVKAVYDQRVSIVRSQLFRSKEDGKISVIKRQQGVDD